MGRTTQARIVSADAVLDAVENAFAHAIAVDVMLGNLLDGAVHGQVVLAGGDDQVGLLQHAIFVDHDTRGRACRAAPR